MIETYASNIYSPSHPLSTANHRNNGSSAATAIREDSVDDDESSDESQSGEESSSEESESDSSSASSSEEEEEMEDSPQDTLASQSNRRQRASTSATTTPANLLKPHGQPYVNVASHAVAVDPMTVDGYNRDTVVHHPDYQLRTSLGSPLQYLMPSFPTDVIPDIVEATNENILSDMARRQNLRGHNTPKLINRDILFQYIGIKVVMAIEPIRGGVEACFREAPRPGTIEMVGRFGSRFGFSYTDFKNIGQYLKLSRFRDADLLQVNTYTDVVSHFL